MKFLRITLSTCLLMVLLSCDKKEEPALVEPPPPEIEVFVTNSQDVPIYKEFVGQVYGMEDIAIRARVEGFLESIHFKEGSQVAAGDLLYTLDSQPFDANVAAKMSRVAEAKTLLAKAESDLRRIRPLAGKKAVSQSDLDAAEANYEAAMASLKAAEANLRAAEIERGYTQIKSPIGGIIGKTLAKVGDFVGRSPNPVILNTVSNVDTIRVQFFITETEYLKLARYIERSDATRSQDGRTADLELILADGSLYQHSGRADFLDRQVDPTTGAILLQASFPNPQQFLRPGQFARIRAKTAVVKEGILIPQRSVIELQGIFSVYVVGPDNTVEKRNITTGPKVGQFWLAAEGLGPQEKVVYGGLQKVKEGTTVTPVVVEIPMPDEKDE